MCRLRVLSVCWPQSPLDVHKLDCRAKGTGCTAAGGRRLVRVATRRVLIAPVLAAAEDLHMAGLALRVPLGEEVGRRRVAEGEHCRGQDVAVARDETDAHPTLRVLGGAAAVGTVAGRRVVCRPPPAAATRLPMVLVGGAAAPWRAASMEPRRWPTAARPWLRGW